MTLAARDETGFERTPRPLGYTQVVLGGGTGRMTGLPTGKAIRRKGLKRMTLIEPSRG